MYVLLSKTIFVLGLHVQEEEGEKVLAHLPFSAFPRCRFLFHFRSSLRFTGMEESCWTDIPLSASRAADGGASIGVGSLDKYRVSFSRPSSPFPSALGGTSSSFVGKEKDQEDFLKLIILLYTFVGTHRYHSCSSHRSKRSTS